MRMREMTVLAAAVAMSFAVAASGQEGDASGKPAAQGEGKDWKPGKPAEGIPYARNKVEKLGFNAMAAPKDVETLRVIEAQLQKAKDTGLKSVVGIEHGGGFGTGVIVSRDGLVMTAAHVSGGVGDEMTCVLPGGKRVKAVSLGLNSENDAALVQLQEGGPFEFVEVAREPVEVGEWVFSLGHSGGYDKDRGPGLRLGRVIKVNPDGIITDCRLIGGDSGGPQFNMHGQLIGIHSRVGLVMEENVSVPVKLFDASWKELADSQFIGNGDFAKRKPAFLGAGIEEVEGGLKVNKMVPGGAAEKAGLKEGDILRELDGVALKAKADLTQAIGKMSSGQKVVFGVTRDGKAEQVEVRLGAKQG